MISRTLFFNTISKPVIICYESYLHKLVGLLSVEAVGETQHIRGSWFLQFTHELVEAGMNLVLSVFSRTGKTQDLHSIITVELNPFGVHTVRNDWLSIIACKSFIMLYYNQILDSILLSTCFLSIRKGFLFLFETNCLSASLSSCTSVSEWGKKTLFVANFDMFSQKPTYIKQIKSKINKPTRLQISG